MTCKPEIQHELLAAAGHRYCWWCGERTGECVYRRDDGNNWAELQLFVGDGDQWTQWLIDFRDFCTQRKAQREAAQNTCNRKS